MSHTLPILIAGGGIGGLAAALALARVGQAVEVLERNPEPSEAGAGIQIGPNGVKVLRQLGVDEVVRASAAVPDYLSVYRGHEGRVLARAPLGATIERRCGAPYWVVHRADLHQALDAAARAVVPIRRGFEVADVVRDGETVAVTATDGRTLHGTALIGADGIRSRVRATVMPGATLRAHGTVAYRTVLPAADAGLLAASEVGAWLAPEAHVVHYPVQAGRSINVVVCVADQWDSNSWNAPAEARAVGSATAGFARPLNDALAKAPGWHKWSLATPLYLATWVRGRVALLGDAAHPILPFLAQGGVMALEDAVQLAASVAATPHDVPLALIRYDGARVARVRRVQQASTGNGRIFHLSGAAALARDLAMRAMPADMAVTRFTWLYGYDGPALAA
jgi:salicylate hydroxylase